MASSKFFLDTRRIKQDSTAPLKIAIRNNCSTSYISTGIMLLPNQWNQKEGKVLYSHPDYKRLNAFLLRKKSEIDTEILSLSDSENIRRWSASAIRDKILLKLDPNKTELPSHTFAEAFNEFMNLKSESTKGVYKQTLSRINAYTDIELMNYEDITPQWLDRFDKFLARTAPKKNARSIHFRNMRAVFNYAINNEYTTYYPFRRYKIASETTRKRSLSVEELREIFSCSVEEYAEIYRDMFRLIFMLIGINVIDLYGLNSIRNSRIEYRRAKTGRLYSIKVEPEALEIIKKYSGNKGLLVLKDRWTDYRNFRHQINRALQRIGTIERVGKGGKKIITPQFPELTTYWARHTWATIAAELDVPDAVISQALGHAGENSTTDIYIKRNQKKVDEANRKVLNWVLYGKK